MKSLAATAFLLQVPLLKAQGNAPQVYDKEHYMSESYAICFVDVAQATVALGQAGLYINQAKQTCQMPEGHKWTNDEHALCSVSVNQILYSFSFAASYLSAAASNCAKTLNLGAYCAADVTNLIADLTTVAAGASHITLTCQKIDDVPDGTTQQELQRKINAQYIEGKTRRLANETLDPAEHAKAALRHAMEANTKAMNALQSIQSLNIHQKELSKHLKANLSQLPGPEEFAPYREDSYITNPQPKTGAQWVAEQAAVRARQNARAQCAFDIMEVVLYFYRAGIGLTESIRRCNPAEVTNNGEPRKMLCAVDVTGLIGSLSFTAAAISLAVAQCPVTQGAKATLGAACAFDLAAAVAAVAGICTSGASFSLTCGKQGLELASRRLLTNESSPLLV
jgi:hypothetical protein